MYTIRLGVVSLKGGRAGMFLGPSVHWMVTSAAEHHSYVVIYRLQGRDATQRGHPGWQRHNNTKAFHSQGQLLEHDLRCNQVFLFYLESPLDWSENTLELSELRFNASTIILCNTVCRIQGFKASSENLSMNEKTKTHTLLLSGCSFQGQND